MGAGPSDLYGYLRPVMPSDKRCRGQKRITITDDWPEVVPVTEAEVRIVEAYFGDLLDRTEMARLEGATSNKLLETLEEWNEYLERHVPYFQEPTEPGP